MPTTSASYPPEFPAKPVGSPAASAGSGAPTSANAPPGVAARPAGSGSRTLVASALVLAMTGVSADDVPDEPVELQDSAEHLFIEDSPDEAASSASHRRAADPVSRRGWERVGDYAVVGGDMLIGKVDAVGRLPPTLAIRGFGHNRLLDRWPDGIVPFELDEAMSAQQRERVMSAIEHWTEKTRISFAERGTERADVYPNWVRFIPENGCASFVGRASFPGNQTYTGQPLYAENCTVGSIVHEIGHAIGLYHEHTRPDRDNFIEVKLDRVVAGREHNFDIVFTNTQTYGEYDYGSIMHYGSRFFSRSGDPTIVAPPEQPIGQRVALSGGDIAAVDRMYATDLALEVDSDERTISDAEGESIDGLVLDVAVRNAGSLGAHDVALDLFIGEDAQWLSVTEDSGWSCATEQARLLCARDTLAEADTSRFELHVNPGTHTRADLVVKLSSRTLDLDESNNDVRGTRAKTLATREDASRGGEPTAGAANPDTPADNGESDGSDDVPASQANSGGGGGVSGLGLLALVLLGAWRRRTP